MKLTCRECTGPRRPGKVLCRACWGRLPDAARRELARHDAAALERVRALYDLLDCGVPLEEISFSGGQPGSSTVG